VLADREGRECYRQVVFLLAGKHDQGPEKVVP
jgi:hypothetical protein